MAYQSKHTGQNIDTKIDLVPELQTEINDLKLQINNLNNSISNIQNSINTINSDITSLITSTGVTTSSQYIRFNNGLQICWGKVPYPQLAAKSTGYNVIALPAPFKDTNYQVATTMEVDAGNSWHVGVFSINKKTNELGISTRNGETSGLSSANGRWSYIAIGYWK